MARGRALTSVGRIDEAVALLNGILAECRPSKASECIYYTTLALLDTLEAGRRTERWRAEAEALVTWLTSTVGPDHPRTKAAREKLAKSAP